MTNAQMAHKKGLDKVAAPGFAYKDMLVRSGLTVINEEKAWNGMPCYEAETETPRGVLHIYCGENGTARIDKPNGTHKWYYENTPAQLAATIKRTLEFYKA